MCSLFQINIIMILLLDYVGICDSIIVKKAEKCTKLLISEEEKKYYVPVEEIDDKKEIEEYCAEPLKMTIDFKIESLIQYGNSITKTLIDWFYHSQHYNNIENADKYVKIKFYINIDKVLSDLEYPDIQYFLVEYVTLNLLENIVIVSQKARYWNIYIWNGTKTVKFSIHCDIPLFYLDIKEGRFYFFDKIVLYYSENKWMFLKNRQI